MTEPCTDSRPGFARPATDPAAMISLKMTTMLAVLVLICSSAAAQDRLPDGGVAEAAGLGAVRAWYGRPTVRYAHGVLGDMIEGGSLIAVDDAGRRDELVLPQTHVFEDITPRLADLDGDGRNEVIAIRTDVSAGAVVAVYHMIDGQLMERTATAPFGRPNRWLSVAGIADFLGDGRRQIAIVKTPHIGGMLEILALRGDTLVSLYPPQPGYSTHIIGSRILSLAGVGDVNDDGAAELALPDQSRRRLIVLRFGSRVETVLARDLPARINAQIQIDGTGSIAAPLETGETARIRLQKLPESP